MNPIKKWLLGRELKKIQTDFKKKTPIDASLDEYVKEAMKRHSDAQKTADRILKAKILDQQTRQTLNKIQELDEDFDDDEEEPEEKESLQDRITNTLLNKLMGNVPPQTEQKTPSKINDGLETLKKTATPEQKKWVKDNYGVDI